MTALSALWLPILVSAVAVFVVSSIIHMTPLWHKTDYPRFANEDRVLDALRPIGLPPGDYMMPRPASSAEMRSPEFKAKMKRGPARAGRDSRGPLGFCPANDVAGARGLADNITRRVR